MMAVQLTIPLDVADRRDFATFDVGANGELLERLQSLAAQPATAGIWLWGAAGSGRSHLLQALCQAAADAGHRAAYLPLGSLPPDRGLLDDMVSDVLTLDDVDVWLGDGELEAALVGTYQNQLEVGAPLVVSAPVPAAAVDFVLPDLASRFKSLASYRLVPPDDEGLRRVLRGEARRRGLELSPATLDFWLARSRRRLPVLLAELDQLDRAALAAQRRLTIPLLKDVLDL